MARGVTIGGLDPGTKKRFEHLKIGTDFEKKENDFKNNDVLLNKLIDYYEGK